MYNLGMLRPKETPDRVVFPPLNYIHIAMDFLRLRYTNKVSIKDHQMYLECLLFSLIIIEKYLSLYIKQYVHFTLAHTYTYFYNLEISFFSQWLLAN